VVTSRDRSDRRGQAVPQRAYSVVQRLLMAGTWLNISLADDLAAILAREPADAVVIDCMLAGVLARSAEFATRWPGRTPPSW
jgi:hypothetical protein